MKKLALALFFLPGFFGAQNIVTIGATPVLIDTVITGLDVPWQMIWGPDDHLWITERKGLVSRIDPVLKTKQVLLDITDTVYAVAEAGLLGMALHPAFASTPEVFLVFTYKSGNQVLERLVKYTYSSTALSNPVVLIDNISGGNAHNGSRLLFMSDGTLLMTTGDGHVMNSPQDVNLLNGKVLRLNTDGSVPADNPYPGKFTFSFGHRNAQGLCYGPQDRIYISEHGPTTDDEFQMLEKGRNYGWPDVEGFCNLPAESTFCSANNVKEPIVDWTPTIAPAGMVYYTNSNFPEFDNAFLLTTLKTKKIVAIKLNASGTHSVTEQSHLANMFGRLRDICIGKNKEIYIATNGPEAWNTEPGTHSILVLRPSFPGSVREHAGKYGVQIMPTVAVDEIRVLFKNEMLLPALLTVYSATGEIVMYYRTKGGGEINLPIADLPAGIFSLCINMHGHVQKWSRFVKIN
jgi:aldose sugar dehydrogenase